MLAPSDCLAQPTQEAARPEGGALAESSTTVQPVVLASASTERPDESYPPTFLTCLLRALGAIHS